MEQIRSFIAVELPDELKQGLARLEDRLKSERLALVKWVDPYSIHLTLQFLGNIASDRVSAIMAVMAEALRGIAPFRLEAKGLGVFPSPNRVRVVWVGLTGDIDRLGQVQKRLESGLAPLGFVPESRPFTPHLTLARVNERARPDERENLGRLIAGTAFEAAYNIPVNTIQLMKSQLTRDGAIYSRLGSVALQ